MRHSGYLQSDTRSEMMSLGTTRTRFARHLRGSLGELTGVAIDQVRVRQGRSRGDGRGRRMSAYG
jgi:hypothetical protein